MFAQRYELWRESMSQQNLLTTLALTRMMPCSIFHYQVNLCIYCFSFQAFFLWMSYGQERVIWQEVEVLLPPHPVTEGLWARNPCSPLLPIPPQGMAARLCFGNLHPPWPAGLLLAPAVSEPPTPPIPPANSVQLLQGASATPTRHCTCLIPH